MLDIYTEVSTMILKTLGNKKELLKAIYVCLIILLSLFFAGCNNDNNDCYEEFQYTAPTHIEETESQIFQESNITFLRRAKRDNRVEYEVLSNDSEYDINVLSTNLYLLWHTDDFDPKIIIMGIDEYDRELVLWTVINGVFQ